MTNFSYPKNLLHLILCHRRPLRSSVQVFMTGLRNPIQRPEQVKYSFQGLDLDQERRDAGCSKLFSHRCCNGCARERVTLFGGKGRQREQCWSWQVMKKETKLWLVAQWTKRIETVNLILSMEERRTSPLEV